MTTAIHDAVDRARHGRHPGVVTRMASGWLVMGPTQHLPGYCLLLPDPVAADLNALTGPTRAQFLLDMAVAGDAVLEATGALRINYAMLGNLEPALHAHIMPRYETEPAPYAAQPAWSYPDAERAAKPFDPATHAELMQRIAAALGGDAA